MRMIPINVEIELAVCASSFEEAVEVVRRGLDEGRYTKEAKVYFDASAVDKYGRIKQYAHGDELKKARRKAAKESPESRPWFFWSYTPFGFCYKRYNLKTRAEAIKKRSALRQEGLKATPIYDARKEEE